MKRIVCIAIILLLAVLAGGLYLYNEYAPEESETSQWLSRSLDRVNSLHVSSPEGSFALKSDGKVWKADVPGGSWNIKAHVKLNRVREYVAVMFNLLPHRYVGTDDVLNGRGLDNPECKLILGFAGNGSEPLTVKFFRNAAGGVFGWNSEYPNSLYEFDPNILDQLSVPALYFLDDYIFRFEEELVDRVQLVQPFGSSWLVEKGDSGFIFKLPGYLKNKAASDSDLKLYIHALALIKAGQLILEPVIFENQVAALTIRVWVKGGKEAHVVEFYTVEGKPDIYMGKSSWLTVPFLLDTQSVAQLVRSAFDIQSRTVMALDIGTVDRIAIDHGSKSYVVARSDSGWWMSGSENDIPGIDMALWRITELKFEALPLNNLSKTAVKLMRCRLLDGEGELLKALTFFADPELPEGQCWMQVEDGMYYPVSSRLLKDLQGMFPAGNGNTAE